jgi:hypothetical protein
MHGAIHMAGYLWRRGNRFWFQIAIPIDLQLFGFRLHLHSLHLAEFVTDNLDLRRTTAAENGSVRGGTSYPEAVAGQFEISVGAFLSGPRFVTVFASASTSATTSPIP